MRCLSVRQPWAWAICLGEKTIENRVWSTDYRGTIAIHASASTQDVNWANRHAEDRKVSKEDFAFGAVIGVVNVIDCVPLDRELEVDRRRLVLGPRSTLDIIPTMAVNPSPVPLES